MMRSSLPWNRWSGHVVVATVLCCCICVLLPLVQGLDQPEIDLEFANHDTADKVVSNSKHTDVATLRNPAESWVVRRRNKPNKSSSKKFVEKDWVEDSQRYGKSKKSIYDKKYFDYLPAELKDSPETSADVPLSKRTNSRRIRRGANDGDGKESQRSKRHGWYVQPVASYSYTVPQMVYSIGNWPAVVSQQYPTVYQQQPNLPFGPSYGNRGPFTTPATVDRTYLPPTTTGRPNVTPPDRTYLPVPTPSPNSEGPVDGGLGNRFNFENNPDRFVFDKVYDTNRVNYNLIPRRQQGQIPPTPPTRRPQAPFRPETATAGGAPGRTTTTPRPSIQHNSDDDYDWSSLGLDSDIGNRLGVGGEDSSNDVSGTGNQARKKPSKCTWAIANCCSHNSDRIRYYCFEQNQCYGAFWGENVCRSYFQAALKEIETYYDV
uniref:Putative vesicle coat complex copii subunit sfb3 n=1 Tax=Culex tarsalis TaxID=7177 RepID=A0A1Q3FJ05_CULTA